MTEKQISEEDLEAVARALLEYTSSEPGYADKYWREFTDEAHLAIQALISRGWRRREDVLEEAITALERAHVNASPEITKGFAVALIAFSAYARLGKQP